LFTVFWEAPTADQLPSGGNRYSVVIGKSKSLGIGTPRLQSRFLIFGQISRKAENRLEVLGGTVKKTLGKVFDFSVPYSGPGIMWSPKGQKAG